MSDKQPRHTWPSEGEQGFRRLSGHASDDGNDRTEKTCTICGLVKITVHPPHDLPWREWRTKDGRTWIGDATPPCLPDVLKVQS